MQEETHLVDLTLRPVSTNSAAVVFCLLGVDRNAVQGRLGEATQVDPSQQFTPSATAAVVDSGRMPVLVYCEAEEYLVAAMLAGRAPGEALEEWVIEMAQLLQFRRQWRRKAVLVRHRHLLEGTAEELNPLLSLANLALAATYVTPDSIETDALYVVLARQLLARSPKSQAIELELEAGSLPWTIDEAVVDIDAIYEHHQNSLSQHKNQSEALVKAEALQDLMRNQIAQLQQDLIGRIARASQARQGSQDGILRLKQEILESTASISELRTKISEYGKSGEALNRERERLGAELRRAKENELALQRNVTAIKTERDAIIHSSSWKLTRPLRALKELMGAVLGKFGRSA